MLSSVWPRGSTRRSLWARPDSGSGAGPAGYVRIVGFRNGTSLKMSGKASQFGPVFSMCRVAVHGDEDGIQELVGGQLAAGAPLEELTDYVSAGSESLVT